MFLVTGAMFYSHEFQERELLAVVFFTILLFALGWTVAVSWKVLRDEVASKVCTVSASTLQTMWVKNGDCCIGPCGELFSYTCCVTLHVECSFL